MYRNAELVAKFYKFIKILPSENDSLDAVNLDSVSRIKYVKKNYQYYPNDFCQENTNELGL